MPFARSLFARPASACTEKVSVLSERHFSQQEISKGVGAEFVDHLVRDPRRCRGSSTSSRRSPSTSRGQRLFPERQVEGHEHRGPVDGVGGENILADQVDICGPESIDRWILAV